MGFSKAFVVGVVFLAGSALVLGCQAKKSDEKPAAATNVDQAQIQEQPVPQDGAPAPGVPTITNDQPVPAGSAEMNQSVAEGSQTDESGLGDQPADESDEDRVSLGRMMRGLFRAARSAIPVPIPASGGSAPNSAEEAPRFPQP